MRGFFGTIFKTSVGGNVLGSLGSTQGVSTMGKISSFFPVIGTIKGVTLMFPPLKKLGGYKPW